MQHAVAYYRVSTARQGRSGLGIEAQRAAVARFAEAEGFALTAEFVEVETGKVPTPSTEGRSSPRRWLPAVRANARSSSPSSTVSRATWPLWRGSWPSGSRS